MIHIERTKIPPELDGENSAGGREYARWQQYFDGKTKKKPGDFRAYSEKGVKTVLIEMFHKKCAYCDTSTTVGDVEHYRPKNTVWNESRAKVADGYWWLAANWDNLLFSCTNCNQYRDRELYGNPELARAGKGSLFPLDDDSKRAQKPGQECNEEPLLINPCEDTPESLLKVAMEGWEEGVLQPAMDTSVLEGRKALTSIKIYGLNEHTYVQRRKHLLRFLRNRQDDLNRLIAGLPEDKTSPQAVERIKEIKRKLGELKDYLKNEQQDMLVIRQVLVPYLQSLGVKVS